MSNPGLKNHSMKVGITPTNGPLKKRSSSSYPPCMVCGLVWTEEELKEREVVQRHMAEKHGYKMAGAQVYRSFPCCMCPADNQKPALYKFAQKGFCKQHYAIAVEKRKQQISKKDSDFFEPVKRDRNKKMDQKRGISRTK